MSARDLRRVEKGIVKINRWYLANARPIYEKQAQEHNAEIEKQEAVKRRELANWNRTKKT